MSLRNIHDTTNDRMEAVCQQHAVSVLAELQQHPHVQLVTHLQVPMTDDDWRWRWAWSQERWNQPMTTAHLKWCVQLSFTYKHNWLVVANPNTSGRSIMFAACTVDDHLRNPQRHTITRGAVYDFASMWKRLDKLGKQVIPRERRYWTFDNHAQNQDQPR